MRTEFSARDVVLPSPAMVRETGLRFALLSALSGALFAGACGEDESTGSPSKAGGGSSGNSAGGNAGSSDATGGASGSGGTNGGRGGNGGIGGTAGTSSGTGGADPGGAAGEGNAGQGGNGGNAGAGGAGANGGEAGTSGGEGGEGGLPPLPPPQVFGPMQTLASGDLNRPYVAMGSFGNAAVLWGNNTTDTMWTRVSTNKTFGGDLRVDSAARPASNTFALAAVGPAEFLAIWSEYDLGNGAYSRRYSNGWSSVQTLEGRQYFSTQLELAVNRAGNGLIGMAIRNVAGGPPDENAVARRVTSGTFSATEDLSLHRDTVSVHAAVADNGNAVVAWRQVVGTAVELWARRLDQVAGWASPERLAAPAAGFISELAAFDDGRVIVLWEEDSATDPKLWESVYRPGTGWASTELPFNTRSFVVGSELTRSRSGALLWVWSESTGSGGTDVVYRLRSPSGPWSAEQIVANDAVQSIGCAPAAYDMESFRITYIKPDPSSPGSSHLWSARYVPGYGFVNHEAIATEFYDQEFGEVAVDETGRGIVSWRNRTASTIGATQHLRVRWFE